MKKTAKPKKRLVEIEELTEEQCTSIDKALLKHRIQLDDENFSRLIASVEESLKLGAFFFNNESRENEKGLRSSNNALDDIEKLRTALSGLSYAAHKILSDAYEHTPTEKAFHEARVSTHIDTLRLFEEVANNLEGEPFQLMGVFGLIKNAMIETCALALSNPPPKVFDYVKQADIDIVSRHTNEAHRQKAEIRHGMVKELAEAFEKFTGRRATDTKSGAFDDFLSACLKIIEPDGNPNGESNRKLIRASLPKYQKAETCTKTP